MRITSSSHSVARCERLRAARDGLSVPWCEEPGAARARGQVSRGELRRSVVTMMMPRSLHRCCSRERQREHCRCTWQQPFVRHGGPPFDGYDTRELFGVLSLPGFTPQLSRGRPVPGLLIHFALQYGSAQLCLPCRAHSDKSNNVPSDRSVTSCADASGMVLVVLMGSTLLWATCEGGRALFLQGRGHSQAHRTLVATLPSDIPQVPQG